MRSAASPPPEELAERLAMPLEKVRKVLKIAKEPISLETPIGDEEDSHLGDFIQDPNVVLPIDAAIQANLRETNHPRAGHPDAARGARSAHALRHRHEHRSHAGRSRSAIQRHARTVSARSRRKPCASSSIPAVRVNFAASWITKRPYGPPRRFEILHPHGRCRKARAEMLAKAKARAEAAKAGFEERTKERLAIAAERESVRPSAPRKRPALPPRRKRTRPPSKKPAKGPRKKPRSLPPGKPRKPRRAAPPTKPPKRPPAMHGMRLVKNAEKRSAKAAALAMLCMARSGASFLIRFALKKS